MRENDQTSVSVTAKRAGDGPKPWYFAIHRNGKLAMTSAPEYATSDEAMRAGHQALLDTKPFRVQGSPEGWT